MMKKLLLTCLLVLIALIPSLNAQEYSVSEIGFSPPHSYLLNNAGITADDEFSDIIPLGFDFIFHGLLYQHVVISGNGVVSFDLANANGFCPWGFIEDIPDVNFPVLNSILAFHDMDPSVSTEDVIGYGYYGTAPNRRFVVNYYEVPHFSASCNSLLTTMQIVLYETTNEIDIYLKDKPACSIWNGGNTAVGLINVSGTEGIAAPGRNTSDSPWTTVNEAWRFSAYDGTNVEAFDAVFSICDTGGGGTEIFNLDLIVPAVIGNQANVTVSFHETFIDANNDLNPLPVNYTNLSNPQIIYARVENTGGLFAISEVTLEIISCIDNDGDSVPTSEEDLNGDGYPGNDDTDNDGIPNYLDADDDNDTVDTILEVAAGVNQGNMQIDTDNDGLEDYLDNDDDNDGLLSTDEDYNNNGTPTDDDLNNNSIPDYLDDQVTWINTVTANPPMPLETCDSPPLDGLAIFDLTITESEILGSQTGLVVTWHETSADAAANTNVIADPTTYQNVINPQTIFARVTDPNNSDFDTTNFDITVLPVPSPITPTPLEVCDDDNDGFAEFNLNAKDAEIIGGEPNVIISYHESLSDAENGVNSLASPYANNVPFLQTIYARDESTITGCFTVVPLDLVVLVQPEVFSITDYVVFDPNGDGIEVFDLTSKIPEILGTQDPSELEVNFYLTLADAANNLNPIPNPDSYTNTSNPQTIYVRLAFINSGCFITNQFDLIADPNLGSDDLDLRKIKVFPNPTTGKVRLSSQLPMNGEVIVYDVQGREIWSKSIPEGTAEIDIDLSSAKSGIYIVEYNSEVSSISLKVIKK